MRSNENFDGQYFLASIYGCYLSSKTSLSWACYWFFRLWQTQEPIIS